DHTAAAPGQHAGDQCAGEQERAVDVGGQHLGELLRVRLPQRHLGVHQAGIVHQQVDRAEGELGLPGGGVDRDPVGDVGGQHHGAAPERLDLLGDGGELLPVAGEQGDVQTSGGQGGGQCGSDASGGAGDQGSTGSGNC